MTTPKTKPKKEDQLQWCAPSDLTPWPDNPRAHDETQLEAIAKSIKEIGWMRPIICDEANVILAGHGAWMASARFIPDEPVPVLNRAGLTTAQKRAYVIADNKLAERSAWDNETLQSELAELIAEDFDISLLGFHDNELKKLTAGALDGNEAETKPPKDETNPETKHDCPNCGYKW